MVSDKVNPKTIELIESLKDKDKIRVLFVCPVSYTHLRAHET